MYACRVAFLGSINKEFWIWFFYDFYFIFVGYPKDAYPPPGHPVQGYPPQGYPPPQGYAPHQGYAAAPPPRKGSGMLEGWYVSLSFFSIKESGDS